VVTQAGSSHIGGVGTGPTINQKEINTMPNLDSYTVYDNRTDRIVATGTFVEIEDYFEDPGRYTVVWDYTGDVVTG